MKSPGITTRPILTIGGDHEVNQVFFDDVRVPVANRVGEEGKGWTYGKYLLEFERGAGIASAKLREALRTISELAESDVTGRAIDDPDISLRMSEVEVDIDALEMTELRVLSALQTGQHPGAVSSILKLRNSEIRQAVTRLGVDVIGHDGLAVEPVRPLYRLNHEPPVPEEMLPVVPEYLNGRAYTIFGGSSEDPARDHREDGAGDIAGKIYLVATRDLSSSFRGTRSVNYGARLRTGEFPDAQLRI